VSVRFGSGGYVKTMEIPLLKGRDFASSDSEAMLISTSAAKLLWGDEDPVGKRVTLPLISRELRIEVIGIVGDVREQLSEKAPPTVYYYKRDVPFGDTTLAIRTAGDPLLLARPVTALVQSMDRDLPLQDMRTMDQTIEETLVAERFRALLLQIFAGAALTLASVGIYSVLSYLVRGRRREIGIRTALGARSGDVVRMVVIEGLKPAALGIALGVIGAFLAAGLLERLVFGVKATDPLTLAIVATTLLAVSVVASLIPAWRASRMDPLTVLRD
jgi:putative ABC transport system permease protein